MLLHDYLNYFAIRQPDAEFACQSERAVTWSQALAEVNRLAHAMTAAGLAQGARFGILAKNCIEYPLLYLAASKAGAVPVPLNYRITAADWEFILSDSGCAVVFAANEYAPQLGGSRAVIPIESLASWASAHPTAEPACNAREDSLLIQMYTSGTTGRPKGAMLTQSNLTSQVVQLTSGFEMPRGRTLMVAPLIISRR
ncbi:MAG: acyl--CoA ligase [Acidobacteria bacterium]|nr:acyl--CoA ligase [Acidobacteriota bacterium]